MEIGSCNLTPPLSARSYIVIIPEAVNAVSEIYCMVLRVVIHDVAALGVIRYQLLHDKVC